MGRFRESLEEEEMYELAEIDGQKIELDKYDLDCILDSLNDSIDRKSLCGIWMGETERSALRGLFKRLCDLRGDKDEHR